MARKSMKNSRKMKGGNCNGYSGMMNGGGGTCSTVGGKRRTRGRRMRGGMFGFTGESVAPGTLVAGAAYTGPVDPQSGAAVQDATNPQGGYTGLGGRRRTRKTRKGKKGSKKSRKMKGGASQISMGGTYATFAGKGIGGMADYEQGVKSGNAF